MGWKKSVELPTGVVVDHWEISEIKFDMRTSEVEIKYEGWISNDVKMGGKSPVISGLVISTSEDRPDIISEIKSFGESKIGGEFPDNTPESHLGGDN